MSSTDQLRAVFNEMRAPDPRRKMNGGPGFGDERDDEDSKLIAMRERNDYVSRPTDE